MALDLSGGRLASVFPDDPKRVSHRINWSDKLKLIDMETPKVGCTLIKRVFQYSELDFDESRLPSDVHERDMSPLEFPLHDQDQFLRCMASPGNLISSFSRNLITRVLSAYLDKIHGHPK